MRSSPRPIRKLLPALACATSLAAGLLLGGCRPSPPPPASALPCRWYQLADGVFEPAAAPGAVPVPGLPWTVQARVSDLAVQDGRLYLAVNRHGVASLEPPDTSGRAPAFRYLYDPLLFRWRTLTTLVPEAGSVLCHLYFNALLNLVNEESLPLHGLCLLRLHPRDGVYQPLPVPFLLSHPGWEGVGFAPLSADLFYIEWKLTEPERASFAYTVFAPSSRSERPAERQEFRQAREPEAVEKRLPAGLLPLAQEMARRSAAEGGPAPAVHFLVRTTGEPLPRRYAHTPAGFGRDARARWLETYAVVDGGRSLLLAPDGLLLEAAGGGRPALRHLPPLPAGFAYTGLHVLGGMLVASWEQTDFTQTGAAGICIYDRL